MNRSQAPEIQTIKSIHTNFPLAEENIYQIFSEEGVFKLEIIFPNSGYGLSGNKYCSIYAMDLILSGTKELTAHHIADKIDELGGFVFKSNDYYNSSITVYGINENLEKILLIVKNAMDNCIYENNELNIYKSKKISELHFNLSKTNFLANRRINQILFGLSHPYALASSEETIHAINSEMLNEFKDEFLVSPYFIFTGSKETPIKSIINSVGFKHKKTQYINVLEEFPVEEELESIVIREGSTQNSIRIGKILPSRDHKDFFSMSLFNLVLGGFFGSRLMKNIREEKGLTYGIHSSITPFKSYCVFKISSECNKTLSSEVKQEIEKEIVKLQTELIGDEELEIAKNYLQGALLRNFDGAFNISERFKSFLELDTKDEYYQEYFDAISNMTAKDIMASANNYFQLNTLKYCISGEV